jgi:thiol-disulfide isomerase/thioredoxin
MTRLLIICVILVCTAATDAKASFDNIAPNDFEKLVTRTTNHKMLLFFASWCKVCKRDFPEFVKLHSKYSQKGIEFIPVSFDEKPHQLSSFLNKFNINELKVYRFKYGNIYELATSCRKLGIKYGGAIPHIVLIKSSNEIIADGNYDISAFDYGLELLLKGK